LSAKNFEGQNYTVHISFDFINDFVDKDEANCDESLQVRGIV
jgi:hypothetical protein